METQESPQTYDVVVVGGGAAGLSGALVLARARRSVVVIDAGTPATPRQPASTGCWPTTASPRPSSWNAAGPRSAATAARW